MSKVTVISPYYNRAALVERTVRGIEAQTYGDYIAYFIDDGSQDNTFAELKKFESGKIKIMTQNNIGFTNTIRNVIERTDSDYIAIQGSGDISYPMRLERQVAYLDTHPDVAAVGCHRVRVSELDGSEEIQRPAVAQDVKRQFLTTNPFSQGEVMMRRSAYEAAGGYRSFFMYRQDLDLWMRICEHGRLAVVPEVLYKVFYLLDSVSHNPEKVALAATFRDFAVYCCRERMAGRPDPLERYGPSAALLRPRSPVLATQLAFAARRRALHGDLDGAQYLIRAAANEAATPSVRLTRTLLRSAALWRGLRLLRTGKRIMQRRKTTSPLSQKASG